MVKRIPEILNAVEFASFIMEKRFGSRIDYSSSTSITLEEIEDRIFASEDYLERRMKTPLRTKTITEETIWTKYGNLSTKFRKARPSMYNRKVNPSNINLMHYPIISIDLLECIANGAVTDLVASSDYTEGWLEDYFVDYRNGIIVFKSFRPNFQTPIKITYTYGRTEDEYGYVRNSGTIINIPSETTFMTSEVTTSDKYKGKLLKITSGSGINNTYRITENTYDSDSIYAIGSVDLSAAGDHNAWTATPQTFTIGGTVVTLNTNCVTQAEVVIELDAALTAAGLNADYEAYAAYDNRVGIKKLTAGSMILAVGIADALATLGITAGTYSTGTTTYTVRSTDTLQTDLVDNSDTFDIYFMNADIVRMVAIYTYLGILIADPTYQHNFTNPFEEPNPQYNQFQMLAIEFENLIYQHASSFKLIL